jgi:large subunit ribosomal protein L30e
MVDEEVEEDVEDVPEEKELPKKRLVRRRKSKKEKESPLSSALRLAVETGKVEFGTKTGIKDALNGSAKLFIIAGNLPEDTKNSIVKYAASSGVPMILFDGTSIELGSICGKPFPVGMVSVYDAGASAIISLAKKK